MTKINMIDIDIRPTLLSNIFVTGGNTILPGYQEQFETNIYSTAPQNVRVKVFSYPKSHDRKFSSWVGASILGSSGSF